MAAFFGAFVCLGLGCGSPDDGSAPTSDPGTETGACGSGGKGLGCVELASVQVSPAQIQVNAGIAAGQEQTYTVVVTSIGTAPLSVSAIALDYAPTTAEEAAGTPAFRLGSARLCAGTECTAVEPGAFSPALRVAATGSDDADALEVDIVFHRPASAAERSATLEIYSNADGEPKKTVTIGTSAGQPSLAVVPSAIDFDVVQVGVDSQKTLGISNSGSDTLVIDTLTLQGSAAFRLTFAHPESLALIEVLSGGSTAIEPPLVIEPGASLQLAVHFEPLDGAPASATLYVHSNDPLAPSGGVAVSLQGNTKVPSLMASPKLLNFGTRVVGSVASLPVELVNIGSKPVTISEVLLAEGSSLDFSLDLDSIGALPATVPVNGKVSLVVRFVPDGANPLDVDGQAILDQGWIHVFNDGIDGTVEVELRGKGSLDVCPTAVIHVQEGEEVIPQTVLHLFGDQSTSSSGAIQEWAWTVDQPEGSSSLFLPSPNFPNPTFEVNVAGAYTFWLHVTDESGTQSCDPASFSVVVIPDEAIHVELLWNTPNDPDQTDEGPESGADLDLHFLHPFAAGNDCDGDDEPDGWFDLPFDAFWFNPQPEWGSFDPAVADNPGLDRDDTDGAGPENLNLDVPQDGSAYRVGVHYWDDHGFGPSFATVRVYIYGQLVWELSDVKMLDRDLWDAATIDWPSGKVSPVVSPSGGFDITPNYTACGFFQP
jgi:hypothetical protein